MPYTGLRRDYAGKWILPAESFVQRINRKLHTLIPCKDLWYCRGDKQWYVRIVDVRHPRHLDCIGPYQWKHMIALGRMLNVFNLKERQCENITLLERTGIEHHEMPLPNNLKFNVITEALQDMQRQMANAGYKGGSWDTAMDDAKFAPPKKYNTVLDDGRTLTDEEQAELDAQIAKRDEARAALARDAARAASAKSLAPAMPDEARAAPAPTVTPEDEDAAVQATVDRLLKDDTVTAAVTPERSKGQYLGWGVYADDAQSADDVDEHEQPPED